MKRMSGLNQQCHSKRPNGLCLQSKAATLIILWTVFIGVVYTTICVAYTVSIARAHINIIVAVLYPLIGFVADVSCGRFKWSCHVSVRCSFPI